MPLPALPAPVLARLSERATALAARSFERVGAAEELMKLKERMDRDPALAARIREQVATRRAAEAIGQAPTALVRQSPPNPLVRKEKALSTQQDTKARRQAEIAKVMQILSNDVRQIEAQADTAESREQAADILSQAAHHYYALAESQDDPTVTEALVRYSESFLLRSRELSAPAEGPRATTDDFAQLEREKAIAHQELGHLDDLEIEARTRQLAEMRQGDSAPSVSITPDSVSESTLIGSSKSIQWEPSQEAKIAGVARENTLAMWQGVKTEALPVTVEFSVARQTQSASASNRPYATVTFGTDGGLQKVSFDLTHGTRVVVGGSTVIVGASVDAPFTGLNSDILDVQASMAFFAAPSTAPHTRTVYGDQLSIGDSITRDIPVRAKTLMSVQSSIGYLYQTRIEFLDAAGNVIGNWQFLNGTWVTPTAIPGDAQSVRATVVDGPSTVPATTANLRLVFQIDI